MNNGLRDDVGAAVASVTDPEYPDVSIVDLGLLERIGVSTDDRRVEVELIPTMLGCPALDMIERDVTAAVQKALVAGGRDLAKWQIDVRFLTHPIWTPDRVSGDARSLLAEEYAVAIRTSQSPEHCPVCGSTELEIRSEFGPTPCRAVSWCAACRNPIEVMRK